MLHIWGIETNPLCRFCLEEEETAEHLFWYCPLTVTLWIEIERWLLNQRFSIHLNRLWLNYISLCLDLPTVLLGDVANESQAIQNIIILLGKVFIHKTIDF